MPPTHPPPCKSPFFLFPPPSLTLLRTVSWSCSFVRIHLTRWTVSEMPAPVDNENILWRKVTFNGAARLVFTPFNLLSRRTSLHLTFMPRSCFAGCLRLPLSQCYYRSGFFSLVECTLRREERTETRERSEIENERCRGGFVCKKNKRFGPEREGDGWLWQGTGEMRPPSPSNVRCSPTEVYSPIRAACQATEMASSSAVVWGESVQCRQQEHHAAVPGEASSARCFAASITPS